MMKCSLVHDIGRVQRDLNVRLTVEGFEYKFRKQLNHIRALRLDFVIKSNRS